MEASIGKSTLTHRQMVSVLPYCDTRLYERLKLSYEHNNLNTRKTAFAAPSVLAALDIRVGSWVCLCTEGDKPEQVQVLALLFAVVIREPLLLEFARDNQTILLHQETYESLRSMNLQRKLFLLKGPPTLPRGQEYALQPDIQVCKKIIIQNIANKQSKYFSLLLLEQILKKNPFVVQAGDTYSISLAEAQQELTALCEKIPTLAKFIRSPNNIMMDDFGKRQILKILAGRHAMNYLEKDVAQFTSLAQLKRALFKAVVQRPCLLHFRNLKALLTICALNSQGQDPNTAFQERLEDFLEEIQKHRRQLNDTFKLCVIFSTDKFSPSEYSDNILKNKFDEFVAVQPPSSEEHSAALRLIFTTGAQAKQFNETQMEGYQRIFRGYTRGSIEKVIKNASDCSLETLTKIVTDDKKSADQLLIQKVDWEDVGGLQQAKDDIIDTVMLPQLYPQLFDEFVKPRQGVLFFGPPGTGKTLLAKAVASQCGLNFLSVKGPELLNMYIGESEKNIREIFQRGKRNAPCVIFFDELDALAPARGKGADSSLVMDRMVAQFLTELDGLYAKNQESLVFVIGATNRPDLLDQSLLRPGRFDKLIYLGVNNDREQRLKVLEAQTRRLKLAKDLDLRELEQKIPQNFTGADYYGLTAQSALVALKRRVRELQDLYDTLKEKQNSLSFSAFIQQQLSQNANFADTEIQEQDFLIALEKVTPSVSVQELEQYEALAKKFGAPQ